MSELLDAGHRKDENLDEVKLLLSPMHWLYKRLKSKIRINPTVHDRLFCHVQRINPKDCFNLFHHVL